MTLKNGFKVRGQYFLRERRRRGGERKKTGICSGLPSREKMKAAHVFFPRVIPFFSSPLPVYGALQIAGSKKKRNGKVTTNYFSGVTLKLVKQGAVTSYWKIAGHSNVTVTALHVTRYSKGLHVALLSLFEEMST